ncbi:MAG: hypothetical protein ACD_39C01172G0001, partial [uncultured bacterium]
MKSTNDNWLNDLRRERLRNSSRNPGAAALMSFFIMGMGQIYAGHIDRGIALMGFHFSGIFAAYSLYNNGLLYDALFPYLGAHLMVMFSYVASVFFILLWIYNIKDAYYLSLFASFRDWFEVERVLLPMLKEQSGSLLTGPSVGSELLEDSSEEYDSAPEASGEPSYADRKKVDEVMAATPDVAETPSVAKAAALSSAEDAEEADVLEFRIDRKTQPKKLDKKRQEEKSETAHVVSGRDFEAVSAYGSSWRLYAGLVVIFALIGIWFNNRQVATIARSGNDSTLFSVSADLGAKPGLAIGDRVSQGTGDNMATVPVVSSGSIKPDLAIVSGDNVLAAAGSETSGVRPLTDMPVISQAI